MVKLRSDILEKILENQVSGIIQELTAGDPKKAERYFDSARAIAKGNGIDPNFFPDMIANDLQTMVGNAIHQRLHGDPEKAAKILADAEILYRFLSQRIPVDRPEFAQTNEFLISCQKMIEKQHSLLKA